MTDALTDRVTTKIRAEKCPVPPADYGSVEWKDSAAKFAISFRKRGRDDAEALADEYLWHVADKADLRALGFCRECGMIVSLQQIGRCVYTECDHYRAQGDVRRMRRFLAARRAKITPERTIALLALIGR
jgi:hypothetical protein